MKTHRQRRVLLLTNENATHKDVMKESIALMGDEVMSFSGTVTRQMVEGLGIDYLVSDRYEHLVPRDVLECVEGRAINSHPSMLPLHRGWQPVFFSVQAEGPVGVSIHQMDENIDTGPVLFQSELTINECDTLRSVHFRCRQEILKGFAELWPKIRHSNELPAPVPTEGLGSYNSKAEFEKQFKKLPLGWDTPIHAV